MEDQAVCSISERAFGNADAGVLALTAQGFSLLVKSPVSIILYERINKKQGNGRRRNKIHFMQHILEAKLVIGDLVLSIDSVPSYYMVCPSLYWLTYFNKFYN